MFTCASTYKMMHNTGIQSAYHRALWKLKVPMKVKIFAQLLLEGKILMQQVLHMRGYPVALGCSFCGSMDMETRDHIMWECSYALRFWSGLWAQLHLLVRHEDGIAEAWIQGRRSLTREARRLWDMTWAAGAWTLERKEIGEPSQDQPSLERGLLDFASACYALLATVFNK